MKCSSTLTPPRSYFLTRSMRLTVRTILTCLFPLMPFSHICPDPADITGAGAEVIDEEELMEACERFHATKPAKAENEAAYKTIKRITNRKPLVIAGENIIEGKERTVHYKAQEARTAKQWITKIERLTPTTEPQEKEP